jgi:hypothetical protein
VGAKHDHPYRGSAADVPISLAVGSKRTPEFSVISEAYFIMLQVEKRLPFARLQCMMGMTQSSFDKESCTKEAPLLRTDWTVWDQDRIVARGSSTLEADAEYTNQYLFKFLGQFMGEAGKKYVVQVDVTKDGSALDVASPHLIVILVRKH